MELPEIQKLNNKVKKNKMGKNKGNVKTGGEWTRLRTETAIKLGVRKEFTNVRQLLRAVRKEQGEKAGG